MRERISVAIVGLALALSWYVSLPNLPERLRPASPTQEGTVVYNNVIYGNTDCLGSVGVIVQ